MRRSLLAGPVLEVAPRLLGMVLRSTTDEGTVAVRLTEVEAYDGPNDPGSHAYRGQTARNAVMFGPPGFLYVYFTYGMHFCMNVVVGPDSTPSAVLLRAGEVIEGVELARLRRNQSVPMKTDRDLARGPARLCVALGIGREGNGVDLLAKNSPIALLDGVGFDGVPATGPRVGLREAADRPWRFWIPNDPTVSPYRPHVPKKRA
ncbi:DNA-3-methyladenine glycosylase [Kribbella sp. VKM Ac-2571]|uniref:DNA-3-methyladenine glycosylase n=1 Tax=Kribbella sp. VKM Ac-2571 TaxID=2512222 RepID=UPI00105FD067|nr:DNA-3-methyladenine glycosylase [Kribbella sp. VKM Ac-2571]